MAVSRSTPPGAIQACMHAHCASFRSNTLALSTLALSTLACRNDTQGGALTATMHDAQPTDHVPRTTPHIHTRAKPGTPTNNPSLTYRFPASAAWMAASNSSGADSLLRKPAAPALRLCATYIGLECMLKMITGSLGR